MHSRSKSNHGFGIIEILVVVVVLGIIGAGAYVYFQQSNTKNDSSNLTNQEKAEIQAACKLEIKDDLLCKAFTNWADSTEPVTYTTTITNVDGTSYTSTSKHDGDNYHSIGNYGGQEMESMQIGNTTYTKMEGVWYKQTLNNDDESDADLDDEVDPSNQADEFTSEENVSKTNYKRLGSEACGDATCVKYEVTYTDDTNSTNYFWINNKTSKVMRTQLKDDDGSSWDMVFAYGPVNIVAPADAKDYSELYRL